MTISIALVGDYNKNVVAHTAIPRTLEYAGSTLNVDLAWSWVETISIDNTESLEKFHGIWAIPGGPYNNMAGVLTAIQFARETNRPFLGTWRGFQYALIEYAHHVCGLVETDYSENDPDADILIVTPRSSSLVGKIGEISFTPGSQLHRIFKGKGTKEPYHCNYSLNPKWKARLENAGIYFTGVNNEGQAHAFELPTHPFFIGTLFQPEHSALNGQQHPLIAAFIEKFCENKNSNTA